ncbi:uncharacterized protein EI97DRAFT_461889 [Westerdykella ornata]|uniref:Uncharacterized protein n=1 Tax=Westerdykella ornata TaxID=318751 RepID=A0A6A6J8L4_WESOR|nr:uncharacterized protein EI97DRAFT_461889 [Westerdykella ornata]KAF2272493.1 hypothetical protein EI97DRAFT_461889 [Westerdykella ornata]
MAPGLASSRYAPANGASSVPNASSAALNLAPLATLRRTDLSRSSLPSTSTNGDVSQGTPAPQAEGQSSTGAVKEANSGDLAIPPPSSQTTMVRASSATQREIVGSEALKNDTTQPAAPAQAVSSWLQHSHTLMRLIFDSVKKDGGLAKPHVELVDETWGRLERLYDSAMEPGTGGPATVYNPEDNLGQIHTGEVKVDEGKVAVSVQGAQKQVQMQQMSVDIQDRLESSVKTIAKLEERISRLTLEKSLHRQEAENYKTKAEQSKAALARAEKEIAALRTDMDTLISSKKLLQSANEKLVASTGELESKLKELESKFKELTRKFKELEKASADDEVKIKMMEQALAQTKNEGVKLKEEADAKVKELEKELADYKAMASQLAPLKDENAKLAAALQQMKDNNAGATVDHHAADPGVQDQLQQTQDTIQQLQKQLDEWKELGTESYNQYAAMQPLYNEAVEKIKQYVEKDEELDRLKAELEISKLTAADVAYWKGKYEGLLANLR